MRTPAPSELHLADVVPVRFEWSATTGGSGHGGTHPNLVLAGPGTAGTFCFILEGGAEVVCWTVEAPVCLEVVGIEVRDGARGLPVRRFSRGLVHSQRVLAPNDTSIHPVTRLGGQLPMTVFPRDSWIYVDVVWPEHEPWPAGYKVRADGILGPL